MTRSTRRGATSVEFGVLLAVSLAAASISQLGGKASSAPAGVTVGGSAGGGGSTSGGSPPAAPANVPPPPAFSPLHDNFRANDGDMKWATFGKVGTGTGSMVLADPYGRAVAAVGAADYTYTLTLQTTGTTGREIWNVGRAVFRYQDDQNYYAVVPKQDGVIELAKMQDGQWRPWLAYANTGTDPDAANTYSIKVAGSGIEVLVNGKTALRYDDPGAIKAGGVGVVNDAATSAVSHVTVTPNK